MRHSHCPVAKKRQKSAILCGLLQPKSLHPLRCLLVPEVKNSLMALGQAMFFSTLDLENGYWQVPVRDQNHERIAFIIPLQLFRV